MPVSPKAEDLGDPTDPDTGWDVVFKRTKTGPLPFNVEYNLSVLKCKRRALNSDEKGLADSAEDIDSKFPRPTPDEVKAALEKIAAGATADDEAVDSESVKELG